MLKFVCIAAGGAIGSVLRYALQQLVQRAAGTGALLPYGTIAVNLIGCLVIGVLSAVFAGQVTLREEYRLGLTVGLLGGFTTFSAFSLESFALLSNGQTRLALANVAVSCLMGIALVAVGYRVGQWLLPT